MAAGLANMVAAMSRGKKAYAQYQQQLSEAISRLSQLREELKASIDADAESYNSVMAAYKKSRESVSADGLIDSALKQATSVPLGVAERAREVLTFFFQAEDGIRDLTVTGVQTCALPI